MDKEKLFSIETGREMRHAVFLYMQSGLLVSLFFLRLHTNYLGPLHVPRFLPYPIGNLCFDLLDLLRIQATVLHVCQLDPFLTKNAEVPGSNHIHSSFRPKEYYSFRLL